MASAGFKWVRVNLNWAAVEPHENVWDPGQIAYYDQVLRSLHDKGFSILAVLGSTGSTPAWAQGKPPSQSNRKCSRDKTLGPPKDDSVFRDFTYAIASRYKGHVIGWDLWNEPNNPCSFPGTDEQFRKRVLAAGYDGIKAAEPNAVVVGPAPSNNISAGDLSTWWDNVLTYTTSSGAHYLVRPVSAISVHGYDTVASIEGKMSAASSYYRCTEDHSYCVSTFWLTEFGFNDPGCWRWFGCGSPDPGQEAITVFEYCRSRTDCMKALYWSAAYDNYDGATQLDSLALLDPATLTPRPKYYEIASYVQAHQPSICPSPGTGSSALRPGQCLHPGEALVDGPYSLALQYDGNLVLYGPSGALWSSGTHGEAVYDVILQFDGNLVLYGPSGALWSSRTDGQAVDFAVLQSDGNFVIYGPGGALWWTGT
jgi:hypothetical protein